MESDNYDSMLDELYDLHKQLLEQDSQAVNLLHRQDAEADSDPDTDNLEIPILTETLNQEIDQEHQSRKVFDEAQHHLFEQADRAPAITEEQVNAIVNKLMGRLKPRVEQLLREKIRAKVIERFNQQS
jgi:replicative DNA helicase